VSGKSGLTAVDRFRRPTRSSNYGKVVQLAVLPSKSGKPRRVRLVRLKVRTNNEVEVLIGQTLAVRS